MFTMISTKELKEMLKAWRANKDHPHAKVMIKAIKHELELRKQ